MALRKKNRNRETEREDYNKHLLNRTLYLLGSFKTTTEIIRSRINYCSSNTVVLWHQIDEYISLVGANKKKGELKGQEEDKKRSPNHSPLKRHNANHKHYFVSDTQQHQWIITLCYKNVKLLHVMSSHSQPLLLFPNSCKYIIFLFQCIV